MKRLFALTLCALLATNCFTGYRKSYVTLRTNKRMEEEPEFAGGIQASISDEQADQDFRELYEKVVTVVTGRPQ